jgi:hypothetical protein
MFIIFSILTAPKLFRAIFKLPAIYIYDNILVIHNGIFRKNILVSKINNCILSGKHHIVLEMQDGEENCISVGFVPNEARAKHDICAMFNSGK